MKKTKWSTSSFFESLKCSINGIKYVFTSQRNILIQSILGIIAVIFGIFLKISIIEWCILCLTMSLVFFAEFINTAIETTVDLITEEYNEKAKIAKDVSAAAVLIFSINSIIVGFLIFGVKLHFIF